MKKYLVQSHEKVVGIKSIKGEFYYIFRNDGDEIKIFIHENCLIATKKLKLAEKNHLNRVFEDKQIR